jgi:uncharacterized protein YdeI (YjbR/CyaY-like superfamily)
VSPLDVSRAIPIDNAREFDDWLTDHGSSSRELIIAIFKKSSGRQTVSFTELLEIGFCHGWVDTQTKSIDDQRYALRFVPRRHGSNWSPRNRVIVRRLLDEGRMLPAGIASLPDDL